VSGLQSSYDPETVISYEAGVKSLVADGRVRLNATALFYDYDDLQVFQIESVQAFITNAAKAEVFGVEIETFALVSESFEIDASLSYLDATYEEFSSVDAVNPAAGLQDLSGNHLPRSPEFSLNVGASYTWLLDDMGSLTGRVNYSWFDEQFFRAFNLERDQEGSYSRTDLSLTWRSAGERWQVEAFVRNLEDDNTISNIIVAAASLGSTALASFNAPRTYGVIFAANFY